jgi:hypothetical protein
MASGPIVLIYCCRNQVAEQMLQFIRQVRTQNFSLGEGWGGADPVAVYNLFNFKNYVIKSCCKHNITLSATGFIYVQI